MAQTLNHPLTHETDLDFLAFAAKHPGLAKANPNLRAQIYAGRQWREQATQMGILKPQPENPHAITGRGPAEASAQRAAMSGPNMAQPAPQQQQGNPTVQITNRPLHNDALTPRDMAAGWRPGNNGQPYNVAGPGGDARNALANRTLDNLQAGKFQIAYGGSRGGLAPTPGGTITPRGMRLGPGEYMESGGVAYGDPSGQNATQPGTGFIGGKDARGNNVGIYVGPAQIPGAVPVTRNGITVQKVRDNAGIPQMFSTQDPRAVNRQLTPDGVPAGQPSSHNPAPVYGDPAEIGLQHAPVPASTASVANPTPSNTGSRWRDQSIGPRDFWLGEAKDVMQRPGVGSSGVMPRYDMPQANASPAPAANIERPNFEQMWKDPNVSPASYWSSRVGYGLKKIFN